MVRRTLFTVAVLAALAAPVQTEAQSLGVDFTGVTSHNNAANFTIGFSFTALTDATVTGLAYYDRFMDGFQQSHDVGLWTAGGTLLASATLAAGTGAPLMGFFRTISIASVALVAGTQYIVGGTSGQGLDDYTWDTTGFSQDPRIMFHNDVYAYDGVAGALTFPTLATGATQNGIFGGNIVMSTVPEPGSMILLLTGLVGVAAVRRRRRGDIADSEEG